jgi:hypothetical protein
MISGCAGLKLQSSISFFFDHMGLGYLPLIMDFRGFNGGVKTKLE